MRLEILNDPLVRARFEEKKQKYLVQGDGCWLWRSNSKTSQGYPLQSIGGRSGYIERVSRIMLFLQGPPPEDGMYALHHCDNPGCVNPSHLYWGTAKQNAKDSIERGRHKKPPILTRDKASRCYIKTPEDINRLAEWCKKLSIREIAEKLNKSYAATHKLLSRFGLKSDVDMKGVGCRPPRTPSMFEDPLMEKELIELSQTMTVTELSKYYGVKRETIYRQLDRLGIKAFKRRV